MKRLNLLPVIVAGMTLLALAGSVGGNAARSQDDTLVAEEAQAPPEPQTHEEALAEAVQDGDLPRLEKLLVRPVPASTLSALTYSLAARPYTGYCGMDSNIPRVPWSRERFLPVFRRLLRAITAADADKGGEGDSLLLAAASLGDLESVRHLVERGANVRYQVPIQTATVGFPTPTSIGGGSPLLEAVRSGIMEAIRSGTDDDNLDPGPLVAYLLSQGADVNAVDARGDTALLAASRLGNIGVVRALLAAGADANIRTADGVSALSMASRRKHKQIAALLAPLTTHDMFEAAAENDTDTVRQLLDAGVKLNQVHPAYDETALMTAARENAPDAARLLLSRGANIKAVTQGGETALHIAAQTGNVAVAEVLLQYGADPDAPLAHTSNGDVIADRYFTERTPFVLALEGGNITVVESFLKHGVRFESVRKSNIAAGAFVQVAARSASRKAWGEGLQKTLSRTERDHLLSLLVTAGLDLKHGPLVASTATGGSSGLLKFLFDKGASPDAPFVGDAGGQDPTPLQCAVNRVTTARENNRMLGEALESEDVAAFVESEKQGKACFRLLLAYHANVHAVDGAGTSAFHYAVRGGGFDMADELLRRGANVNAADTNGQTALHRTVSQRGHADESALRYLLRHRANRTLRDKNGDTALSLARKHGLKNAIALLTKK